VLVSLVLYNNLRLCNLILHGNTVLAPYGGNGALIGRGKEDGAEVDLEISRFINFQKIYNLIQYGATLKKSI